MAKLKLDELAEKQTQEILTYLEGNDNWQIWKQDGDNQYCISKMKKSNVLNADGREFQKIHVDGFTSQEPRNVIEFARSHERKKIADSTITSIGRISELETMELPEGLSIVYQLHESPLVPARLFVFLEYKKENVSTNRTSAVYSAVSVLPVPDNDLLNNEISK